MAANSGHEQPCLSSLSAPPVVAPPEFSSKRSSSIFESSSPPLSPSRQAAIIPFSSFPSDVKNLDATRSSKRFKKSSSTLDGNLVDAAEEEDFFDEEDFRDEEWVEHLAIQKSSDNRSQLLHLMERLQIYDEEQLRLALRAARNSVQQVASLEAKFLRPIFQNC